MNDKSILGLINLGGKAPNMQDIPRRRAFEKDYSNESFNFEIIIHDACLTDDVVDRLFDANCDDALVCSLNDLVYLVFDRVSDSLEEAIESAFEDIQKAGFKDFEVKNSF